jgi:hypothetical protein
MALASLSAVRTALAGAADNITGLRASATVPDSINPPTFVVGEITQSFDQTMQRGLDEILITCRLYVSRADDKHGQDKLDAYLAGSGSSSIKATVEADRTLGGACSTLRLETQQGYGQYEVAGIPYFGAEFTIRVWG